ncbi:MAG TPA: cyclic nucleotide-binding domain-containing protein [Mycobacteriales bacterium]|nr:cyclic nucleotide-binding domain-containing protein [Mycobacteriales bacterium]HVU61177.1 cyclic nucleotide-binding domain-containing protein [Mycobacteriales bacterium]
MDVQGRVALLAGLELFARTDRAVLEDLAGAIEVVEAPASTVVVARGDAADALWVLATGEVNVSAGDADLRTLQAPAYFGEVGALTGNERIATVTTTEPSTLWRISSLKFLDLLGRPTASE